MFKRLFECEGNDKTGLAPRKWNIHFRCKTCVLFTGGCCPKKHSDRLEYDEITTDVSTPNILVTEGSPLMHENASIELTASQVSTTVSLPRVRMFVFYFLCIVTENSFHTAHSLMYGG